MVDLDRREPGVAYHDGEVALAGATLEDPSPRPPDGALDPSKESAAGRHRVLQEGVPPAGPQNMPDFADDLPGIGNRAQQKARDDRYFLTERPVMRRPAHQNPQDRAAQRTADQAQRPREIRGALRSSPDSDTDRYASASARQGREDLRALHSGPARWPPTNWPTISRTSTTTSPKRSSKPAD